MLSTKQCITPCCEKIVHEGIFLPQLPQQEFSVVPPARHENRKRKMSFLSTTTEALQSGYRPCKVCYPLEKLGETPAPIKRFCEIGSNRSLKFPMKKFVRVALNRMRCGDGSRKIMAQHFNRISECCG